MKEKIDLLRMKLDRLVTEGAAYNKIYKLSVKLDTLIVIYYKDMYSKTETNLEKSAV